MSRNNTSGGSKGMRSIPKENTQELINLEIQNTINHLVEMIESDMFEKFDSVIIEDAIQIISCLKSNMMFDKNPNWTKKYY